MAVREPDGGRINPSSHSSATVPYRREFFRDLVDWLIEQRPASSRGRLLDFGCADLRLAAMVDGTWVVDGYDEWDRARDAARRQQATLSEPGVIYDRVEDIPQGRYDVVVLNSLIQYVPDLAAVRALFDEVGPLLAPDAAVGAVITDAVSDGSSRLADLSDVVAYNLRTNGLRRGALGIVHMVRSAGPSPRFRHRQADLAAVARAAGLTLTRHPDNLSAFSRRATFVLRPAPRSASTDPPGDYSSN